MKLNEAVTFVCKHWVLTSNALRASLCAFGFRSITLQGEVQHLKNHAHCQLVHPLARLPLLHCVCIL